MINGGQDGEARGLFQKTVLFLYPVLKKRHPSINSIRFPKNLKTVYQNNKL
jgi:hypothetical protein